MPTKYTVPSVESIVEASEDESRAEARTKDEGAHNETTRRPQRSPQESMFTFTPMKANTGKERERSRRPHKSTGASSGKPSSKSKPKNNTQTRRATVASARDDGSREARLRHRWTMPNHSVSSSSSGSSSDEDEHMQDHRAVLAAARGKLTSPSVLSNLTSLTTTTNTSSGSSGSNSTVTQASITKQSNAEKQPQNHESPMSPACPDPPNVFAYLEEDPEERADEDEHNDDEGNHNDGKPQWPANVTEGELIRSSVPAHLQPRNASGSSSSSYQGGDEDGSERAADNDTDRSSSPERSVKGHDEHDEHDEHEEKDDHHVASEAPDQASAKLASQMAAAQQRQNLHANAHAFGTPNMQRGTAKLPHLPSKALSPRYVHHVPQRSLPRGEKLPVTGYELLASRLSGYKTSNGEKDQKIRPMYRKFEALNHRLLLHLQDEISELEEQLHRLDNADTQSRRTQGHIMPASRRMAAQAGGELQWHKVDILGKIGFKLGQYNQALASFNSTQSLEAPAATDIKRYRAYLSSERVIAEAETRFLDPADDLVSICSDTVRPPVSEVSHVTALIPTPTPTAATAGTAAPQSQQPLDVRPSKPGLSGLATAVAVAVLVPILTFSVIPGFLGRMTVVLLVALGTVGALYQSGVVGSHTLNKDLVTCSAIYGGVMVIIAGIMA